MTQINPKDTLYLLPPGFADNDRREYCPECAEMWGLLAYFPAIKECLSIIYVPIERPRTAITDLLGEDHQNAPTLILHPDSPVFDDCGIEDINEHKFIGSARGIGQYYARRFGTPFPRGS